LPQFQFDQLGHGDCAFSLPEELPLLSRLSYGAQGVLRAD
jgi:hypothetical protein